MAAVVKGERNEALAVRDAAVAKGKRRWEGEARERELERERERRREVRIWRPR